MPVSTLLSDLPLRPATGRPPVDPTQRRTGAAGPAAALAAAADRWLPLVEYRPASRWTHLLARRRRRRRPRPGAARRSRGRPGVAAVLAALARAPAARPRGVRRRLRRRPRHAHRAGGRSGRHRHPRCDGRPHRRPGPHFGPHYVHQVTNLGDEPAVSVHVYTPAWLDEHLPDRRPTPCAHRHRAGRGGLVSAPVLESARPRGRGAGALDRRAAGRGPGADRPGRAARGGRPRRGRRGAGRHPPGRPAGAARARCPAPSLVERNVLEWRFDPASEARLPVATGYDLDVIVLCSEGYTSSLAADALRSLGLHRATDVVGGFLRGRRPGSPTTGTGARLLIHRSAQPAPGPAGSGTTVADGRRPRSASSTRRPRTAWCSPGARRPALPWLGHLRRRVARGRRPCGGRRRYRGTPDLDAGRWWRLAAAARTCGGGCPRSATSSWSRAGGSAWLEVPAGSGGERAERVPTASGACCVSPARLLAVLATEIDAQRRYQRPGRDLP